MPILPSFNTKIQELALMQSSWSSILNPLLRKPSTQGVLLQAVSLSAGVNVINHLLDRKLQGWTIVDIDAAATVYRSAPKNDKTLTLTSSAPCVVDIQVY